MNRSRRLRLLQKVFKRCQRSSMYFIENFCRVKHPKAGIIPFNLFKYQKSSILEYLRNRYVIYRKCRQCGISTLTGAFALWYAMFYTNKTVLIVSKRDKDAKDFLAKNVKFVYDHLPDEFREIYGDPPATYNEHEVVFPNGSSITSLTSSPHTLRSNSASLNILDEVAFMPHMEEMWSAGQPTLVHGGCLAPDSLVNDKRGLRRIDAYHSDNELRWEHADADVFVEGGDVQHVTHSYNNGIVKTRRIETCDGYLIEASYDHKLRVLDESGEYVWRKVKHLAVDDHLVLSDGYNEMGEAIKFDVDIYNQELKGCKLCGCEYDIDSILKVSKKDEGYCASCITTMRMTKHDKPPKTLTIRLAEMIGALVGDGFCTEKGTFGFSCDRTYPDFIDYLHDLIKGFGYIPRDEVSEDDYSVRFNSRSMQLLFKKNNIVKPSAIEAFVPDVILRSLPKMRCAFLRGLFETDGCVSGNYVSMSSSSIRLVRQVQIMLLGLGMRTRMHKGIRKNGYSKNPQYVLSLKTRRDIVRYRELIGFISNEKRSKLSKIKSCIRIHNDRFTNKEALHSFYDASKGLPANVRKNLYGSYWRGSMPRHKVKELCERYPSLEETALGYLATNNLFTDKIKRIEQSESMTYDITVEETHSYIANGFISHNSVVAISTTNGVGNWYHTTWEDAEAQENEFKPIHINWWDMDWKITYRDEFTGEKRVISPTDGIRKCQTKAEIDKWGPYWSPWLEEQYRALQRKGEAHLFRQEVLAEFIGSGNTVLSREQLLHVKARVSRKFWTVGLVKEYYHPVTEQNTPLDFQDELRIWRKPVRPEPDVVENGRVIKPGRDGHTYSMGVDISSGEADDYSAIVVLDCDTMEQVAELNMMVQPSTLLLMIDYLARWYNGAFVVPERAGLGIPLCQDLYNVLGYANVYRMRTPSGKLSNKMGFPTGGVTKPALDKELMDNIGEDGVQINSQRLSAQLQIYVYLGQTSSGRKKTGHVDGPGNHSDIVIALGLALLGVRDAVQSDQSAMMPKHSQNIKGIHNQEPALISNNTEQMMQMLSKGGSKALIPLVQSSMGNETPKTIDQEMMSYANQLGGLPIGAQISDAAFRRSGPIKLRRK